MKMLRDFREKIKLNQNEFAESIGVSLSLYVKIECGDRKPSREFMSKLKSKYPEFDVNNFF